MDVLYLVNAQIVMPIILLAKVLSCGKVDLVHLKDKIDVIYKYFFGMSYQDIAGFRRLRTISQLTFETMVQILLQVRILLYNAESVLELGITTRDVWISLSTAVLHGLLEFAFIFLESESTKTSIMHYSIICFNGRFGWIPFTN